jgi:uncharacterized membrane protein
MISWYPLIKLIHIISATLLFGTGLGSAYYFYAANQTRDLTTMLFAARAVVIADYLFTTPAVIIQPLTGFFMLYLLHYSLTMTWLWLSLLLYVLIGCCWLPVVVIQIKLKQLLEIAVATQQPLPDNYYRLFRLWFSLGWPAFIGVLLIFYLMVYKLT